MSEFQISESFALMHMLFLVVGQILQPVVLPYPEDYHLPLNRVLRSIHRSTIYLIKVQLPLPQEDDYNRHWSVLRQTIRLINRMTICRTLKELSSLTGYLKV